MDFYFINEEYINYLKRFENKIMNGSSHYKGEKFTLGVVFKINSINYYAPISSIKDYQLENKLKLNKEYRRTCYPIIGEYNKEDKILSTIRLDFMFPVPDLEAERLIINNIEPKKRSLIRKEYKYVITHKEEILKKAEDVYNKATVPTHFLYNKCCKFKILETKYQEWIFSKNAK